MASLFKRLKRQIRDNARAVCACDERLPPPPRTPVFRDYDLPREPRRYDCGHARPRRVALRGWFHGCPGCERFERRKTRHWLILSAVAAVLLGVTCSARANDLCAPYSPRDGVHCRPPTRLGYLAGVPVCYCPGPKVASR